MNAPASIIITPVFSGRETRRGRADAGLRARHRPSRCTRARRHRHDGAAPGDGRHGSPPSAAERAGLRSRRHRHRRQHTPARRPLRRRSPLRRQADLCPAPGARGRAQQGATTRFASGSRRPVCSTCRSTASTSCCPGLRLRPGAGSHTRHADRHGGENGEGARSSSAATSRCGSASSTSRPPKAGAGFLRSTPRLIWLTHEREPWRPAPSKALRRPAGTRRPRVDRHVDHVPTPVARRNEPSSVDENRDNTLACRSVRE